MPYKAFRKDDEWCVYKIDSKDNAVGSSLGCHSSRDEANKQVAALYASEKEIRMSDTDVSTIKKLADEFLEKVSNIFKSKEEKIDLSKLNETPFFIFKDKNGDLKWISRYSNNRRDQDNPPEIISAESHEYFEKAVDTGIIDLPELWVWHMPLKIGKAEVVTFDKENGIAIAGGSFCKHAQEFAELVAQDPESWGVSHGMPGQFVKRSKEDPTVITKHITTEISILPKYAAANKWADFRVLKEVDMTIKQEKLDQLKAMGASDDMLDELVAGNKTLNEALNELEIESKEINDEEPEVKEEVQEEVQEEVEEPEVKEEVQKQADETPDEQDDELRKEIVEALSEIGKVLKELSVRVEALETKEENAEEIAEEKVEKLMSTPSVALKEMFLQSLNTKQNSATQSEDTVIDGRTKLAKDAPAETKEKPISIVKTGVPMLDEVLTGIVAGAEQPA